MHQMVQMGAIRLSGMGMSVDLTPNDGGQRFCCRISQNQQAHPGGYLRIAGGQHYRESRNKKSTKIRAGIAKEQFSKRKIDHKEPQDYGRHQHRQIDQHKVFNPPANQRERRQNEQNGTRSKPVKTIDHIDRICQAAHCKGCETQRNQGICQQRIGAPDIDIGNRVAG